MSCILGGIFFHLSSIKYYFVWRGRWIPEAADFSSIKQKCNRGDLIDLLGKFLKSSRRILLVCALQDLTSKMKYWWPVLNFFSEGSKFQWDFALTDTHRCSLLAMLNFTWKDRVEKRVHFALKYLLWDAQTIPPALFWWQFLGGTEITTLHSLYFQSPLWNFDSTWIGHSRMSMGSPNYRDATFSYKVQHLGVLLPLKQGHISRQKYKSVENAYVPISWHLLSRIIWLVEDAFRDIPREHFYI